jgi:hypothetical protein
MLLRLLLECEVTVLIPRRDGSVRVTARRMKGRSIVDGVILIGVVYFCHRRLLRPRRFTSD